MRFNDRKFCLRKSFRDVARKERERERERGLERVEAGKLEECTALSDILKREFICFSVKKNRHHCADDGDDWLNSGRVSWNDYENRDNYKSLEFKRTLSRAYALSNNKCVSGDHRPCILGGREGYKQR